MRATVEKLREGDILAPDHAVVRRVSPERPGWYELKIKIPRHRMAIYRIPAGWPFRVECRKDGSPSH